MSGVSRRQLFKLSGAVTAGAILAGCQQEVKNNPVVQVTRILTSLAEATDTSIPPTAVSATVTSTIAESTATQPPTATSTEEPPEAQVTAANLKYSEDYLAAFTKITIEAEKKIGEKEYRALLGIKTDGTNEVLGLEFEPGEMVRVGEYKDPDTGFSYYTYFNPSPVYNPKGRLQVTRDTPEVLLMEVLLKNLSKHQLKDKFNGDINQLKQYLKNNGNILEFMVPTRLLGQPDVFKTTWDPNVQPKVPANFNLPVELVLMGYNKDLQTLPKETLSRFMYADSTTIDDQGFGGLVWVDENDGHLQIFSLNGSIGGNYPWWNDKGVTEYNKKKVLLEVGSHFISVPQVFSLQKSNTPGDLFNMFVMADATDSGLSYNSLSAKAFEFHIEK